MNPLLKSKLPRLPPESYRGLAIVFWTHTFENRARGWLDASFHIWFREVLLHAGARYNLACPICVLMPDLWHLVWMGLREDSDQARATAFLRKHLRSSLLPAMLQDRPHDHVLREHERERGALMATCRYIRENPVRAKLVGSPPDWPDFGAMIPGYPILDPDHELFWEDFWKIYNRLVAEADSLAKQVRE